jgi:eukaryotic-like serine/threonine-protein kinase
MMAVVLLMLREDPDSKSGANPPATNQAQPTPTGGASNPGTNPATNPPTTQPTTNPPAPTTPAAPPAFTLPAGWRMRDNGSGFKVPVPEGWTYRDDGNGRARWSEPNGNRFLLIDQTRNPKPDPLVDWQQNEAARRDGYANYDRVRLARVKYFRSAADWEFTYNANSGTRLHVLNRGFITAPDQAYSIYWSTPDSQWQASKGMLDVIVKGFQPARR